MEFTHGGYFNEILQENVRTLADALSVNEEIKSLTVAVPCHCYVEKEEVFSSVDLTGFRIMELLASLKRIRVENPVQFVTYFGIGRRESRVQCSQSNCQRLAQIITTELGHLHGAPLIEAEEKWRRLKTLPRPQEAQDLMVRSCRRHPSVSFEEIVEDVERRFQRGFADGRGRMITSAGRVQSYKDELGPLHHLLQDAGISRALLRLGPLLLAFLLGVILGQVITATLSELIPR